MRSLTSPSVRTTRTYVVHSVLAIVCVLLLTAEKSCSAVAGVVAGDNVPVQEGADLLSQIVFASCNHQWENQSYWDDIAEYLGKQRALYDSARSTTIDEYKSKCDALVWLGDVIYADLDNGREILTPRQPAEIEQFYIQQKNNPYYERFTTTSTLSVMGVWDDHDMGLNDCGKEFPHKKEVQKYFLDFLGVSPQDTYRRTQEGLYNIEYIPFRPQDAPKTAAGAANGDKTQPSPQDRFHYAACVVILDLRYHRDPVTNARNGDMLGEEQWMWLRKELHKMQLQAQYAKDHGKPVKDMCAVMLVASSVQFLMDEKPLESWDLFPRSRSMLLYTFRSFNVERVVFLSGDVHLGEIGIDNTSNALGTLGYPVVEITSSGLTHSDDEIHFFDVLFDTSMQSPRRIGSYLHRNFGTVQLIQTAGGEIQVILSVHSLKDHGKVVVQHVLPIHELTYAAHGTTNLLQEIQERRAIPLFAPAPYPALKRHLRKIGCHVIPCMPEQYFIFFLIGVMLFIAISVVVTGLAMYAFYSVLSDRRSTRRQKID